MQKSIFLLLILSAVFGYINQLVLDTYQTSLDIQANNTVQLTPQTVPNTIVNGVNYTLIYRDDISEKISLSGYITCDNDTYLTTATTVINYQIGDIVTQGTVLFTDDETQLQITSSTYGRIIDITIDETGKTIVIENWDTLAISISLPIKESSFLTPDTKLFYLLDNVETQLTISSIVLNPDRDVFELELDGLIVDDLNVNGARIEVFFERIYETDVKIISTKSLGEQLSENRYIVTVVTQTAEGFLLEEVEVEIGVIVDRKAILITNLPINTKVMIAETN